MELEQGQIVKFLEQRHLFRDIHTEEIEEIAPFFFTVSVPKGASIHARGNLGKSLFFVYQGKVEVYYKSGKNSTFFEQKEFGDHFGETVILDDHPHDSDITALEDSVLLVLDANNTAALYEQFPEIALAFKVINRSKKKASFYDFDWMADDEIIYFISTKHYLGLIRRVFRPIFLAIASVAFFVLALLFLNINTYTNLIFGIGISFSILWLIWEMVDWRNDYYIITNHRIISTKQVLFFNSTRHEVPISTIHATKVDRTYWGRVFDYGDVDIQTMTISSSLAMGYIPNPDQFTAIVEELVFRLKETSRANWSYAAKQTIRQTIGLESDSKIEFPIAVPTPDPEPKTPFKLFKTRQVYGDEIIYRKHWFVIIKKIWWQLLGLLAILLVTFTNFLKIPNGSVSGSNDLQALIMNSTVASLILLGILVYQWIDYRNEIYKVTKDTIVDIEKKPLGFQKEKTAPIEKIQSIKVDRTGLLRVVFNYGSVMIHVADDVLEFREVQNPSQVQRDIFIRKQQQSALTIKEDAERSRSMMSEFIKAYHEETQNGKESFQQSSDELDYDN